MWRCDSMKRGIWAMACMATVRIPLGPLQQLRDASDAAGHRRAVEGYDDLGPAGAVFGLRAQRYAAVQARPIGPDGSFPVIGRSITHRMGAFHLLAQLALTDCLPKGVTPAQVIALTAVIQRTLGSGHVR